MIDRPENPAVRAARQRLLRVAPNRIPPPFIPKAVLDWLEASFPARCYGPRSETLEEHLMYAGKRELIDDIARIVDGQSSREQALQALAEDTDPEADALVILHREDQS